MHYQLQVILSIVIIDIDNDDEKEPQGLTDEEIDRLQVG